jgi:hypothetical protein
MNKIIKIHCLHRSGSTFLTKFYKYISLLCEINYYQCTGQNSLFNINYFLNSNRSFCICPIRTFPLSNKPVSQLKGSSYIENEINDKFNYIIQLRDPRDILVSQYYSFGWTHGYVKTKINHNVFKNATNRRKMIRNMTIDEYAKSNIGYKDLLERYIPIIKIKNLNKKNIKIIKYSDMVLNFSKWVLEATSFFKINKAIQDKAYNKFKNEFLNIKETNPNTFIKNKPLVVSCGKNEKRKVYPGDYLNKFSKNTIQFLNEQFKPILKIL